MGNELFTEVIKKIDYEIPPLFIAILHECCENVEKSDVQEVDKVNVVWVSFYSILPILKGTIDASLDFADTLNLNYRDQSFGLTKQSQTYQLLTSLLSTTPV